MKTGEANSTQARQAGINCKAIIQERSSNERGRLKTEITDCLVTTNITPPLWRKAVQTALANPLPKPAGILMPVASSHKLHLTELQMTDGLLESTVLALLFALDFNRHLEMHDQQLFLPVGLDLLAKISIRANSLQTKPEASRELFVKVRSGNYGRTLRDRHPCYVDKKNFAGLYVSTAEYHFEITLLDAPTLAASIAPATALAYAASERVRIAAEMDSLNDDDDVGDGKGSGGWPSTTGNPSGSGRSNG